MRAALKEAIARGPVGLSWSAMFKDNTRRGIAVIDANEWAVAEFGAFTDSGYTELLQVFPTKTKAVAYLRSLAGRRGLRGRYILLNSGGGDATPDKRWMQAGVR